jgi:signal transduction histidine kinase/sugar lactone lactonase YvrE
MQSASQESAENGRRFFPRSDEHAGNNVQHPIRKRFPATLPGWLMALLCLMAPCAVLGAEDDSVGQYYTVKVWGADDGLSENSVTDVTQTPEGYLWAGTLFGSVLRFDGTRFASYNSANTPEFSLKWGVPRLMVDRAGTLWISMHDGGMTTWDHHGFNPVFASTNQPDRLLWSAPGKVIFEYGGGKLLSGQKSAEQWDWRMVVLTNAIPQSQCCADAAGRIWYLCGEHGIGIWDGQKIQVLAQLVGLGSERIKVLVNDAQGHIWVGTDQSLAEWHLDCFKVMTPTNGEATLNVKRIVPSGANSLWVEANGRMRCCTGQQWVAESVGWKRELGRVNTLRFLHGDPEGGLWSAVGDMGLIHVLPDGTFHRLTTRKGLPSNTVHFAYQDREGNTWTGYDRGGLVQVRRRLFQAIGREQGLDDGLINTVCQDAHGRTWIGTHSGEVGCFENGICTNYALPKIARIQDSCVTSDSRGRVWIGAQGAGLLSRAADQIQRILAPPQLQTSAAQAQDYPRLLLAGRDGRLWVGTLWSIISVTNGEPTINYVAEGVGDHPTALAEAADGTIWAGTLAGLLLRWNGSRFVPVKPPDQSSLGRIWALWSAPDGGLWAGTEEGGLLHWSNGRFYRFTMKDGLPSDSIVQVLGDPAGNLWLGTRAGIARIFRAALARYERGELNELPVSAYGTSDGLLTIGSAIIFQPNCWRGQDGTLFFAMANSVASVKPGDVHINPVPPTVALEQLRADDRQVLPERIGAILTDSRSNGNENPRPPIIKIGPGRGDLEFHYTGLSLGSPSRVRFKYKLDGLETSWNDAGAERKAIYRRVPPGDYVFRVVACNSDGVCSEGGGLLVVTVQPHIYQRAWFRGGAALLLGGTLSLAGVAAMRRRLRHRLEQSERQHELERERARIAQDLHDDLGAGLTEIGLLGGLLRDPTRFETGKQDALERIVQRCQDLVMALDEIVWAVNPRNDSVNSLAGYLCRYAQSFLQPTSIRCRLHMQEAEPDHPFNSEQRHNLFLAFKEALTNVVRHSGATEVVITIYCKDMGRLLVGIEDNGHGLPVFVEAGADGLNNLRQRMEQIGGHCEIRNRDPGGVTVTLSLPLAAS